MKYLLPAVLALAIFSCQNPNEQPTKPASTAKVEVLLIGTSHWNNYQRKGLDIAQSSEIDILSPRYKSELEEIARQIVDFNPSKIFVERPIEYQPKLDSLYQLYTSTDWGDDKRNEIYQLGFRVAKMLKHPKVYGADYHGTDFPYDSLMKAMKAANQTDLIQAFGDAIKKFETDYNKLVADSTSLKEIFNYLNSERERKNNFGWYLNGANIAGTLDNHIGPFLVSEWIRRNVYMYSLIQKQTEPSDQRIMVLMGAGHIAVIENLMQYNPEWKIVELKDIVK